MSKMHIAADVVDHTNTEATTPLVRDAKTALEAPVGAVEGLSSASSYDSLTPNKDALFIKDISGDLVFASASDFQQYATNCVAEWELKSRGGGGADKGASAPLRPCLYIYKRGVYDVTDFVDVHPGGGTILHEYNGKDVTSTFHDEYNMHGHTAAALNMLLQYRIGFVQKTHSTLEGQLGEYENYALEELTAYPRMTADEIIYKDFVIRRDRGLVWQAMFLTLPQYLHLTNTPIYIPNCRLFDTFFVEPFSRTKYWVVAALWLPLSAFWLLRGVMTDYAQQGPAAHSVFNKYLYYPNGNTRFFQLHHPTPVSDGYSDVGIAAAAQLQHARDESSFYWPAVLLAFSTGLFLWTLTEYCLHRFLFHFDRLISDGMFDNPLCKLVHLLLHGIHHIIPMDPDRLVFPPALFVVACTCVYNFYGLFIGGSALDIVGAGLVLGYVCYDEIHYFIHHTEPVDPYFKDLKKYHHAHHFVDDTKGYGISNKLWDIVFGTACKKS